MSNFLLRFPRSVRIQGHNTPRRKINNISIYLYTEGGGSSIAFLPPGFSQPDALRGYSS